MVLLLRKAILVLLVHRAKKETKGNRELMAVVLHWKQGQI
jgi:hypothetical protein